jgi:hypothetical protein
MSQRRGRVVQQDPLFTVNGCRQPDLRASRLAVVVPELGSLFGGSPNRPGATFGDLVAPTGIGQHIPCGQVLGQPFDLRLGPRSVQNRPAWCG